MMSTVAKLSATLGPRRTTKRPLQELRRGPEGGGGAASLAVASSQQTGLAAASCEEDNQYSLQTIRQLDNDSAVYSVL